MHTLKPSWALVAALLFVLPAFGEEAKQEELSDATQAGIGCLVTSGATVSASMAAGPTELLMIAAGGLLVPSGSTALMVGLTATLFAAACSVGSTATPAVLWLTEQVNGFLDYRSKVATPAATLPPVSLASVAR